jgi:general secretion pathway protein L
LALSGLAFVVSLGAWLVIGGGDDARMADLQNRIAERRSELMNRRGPAAEEALKALQARKWAAPSAVMVLEALSKTLPDNAHLTELRIEGGKVQIGGSAPTRLRSSGQSSSRDISPRPLSSRLR